MTPTLPIATTQSPFERMNAIMSTFEFASDLDDETRGWLESTTLEFNKTIPGSAIRPRFHLRYPKANALSICQRSDTEAPTKGLFDRLVTELGITLAEAEEQAGTQPAVLNTQPAATFDEKAGRYRGPGGFFLPTPRQGARA